jgi:hypothetical protein
MLDQLVKVIGSQGSINAHGPGGCLAGQRRLGLDDALVQTPPCRLGERAERIQVTQLRGSAVVHGQVLSPMMFAETRGGHLRRNSEKRLEMATSQLHERAAPVTDGARLQAAPAAADLSDPRYQAFWLLRLAYTAIPLTMGIDNIVPGTAQQFMYFVGGVEILAGILVLLKPRYAAYIVAAWLAGIVINLFSYGKWYDVGVRDLGLMGGALVLGRLASVYDPPLRLRRR